MKVYQVIARALADNGINLLFGVLGEANLFFADSFVSDCGGRFVAAANEAGAAGMALGYATVSGKVGVCTVTHGAGMVNTMTMLVEGVRGSTPMILLCGDTPVAERRHLQDVAQREFASAAGAGFEQLRAPATVAQDVATAIRRASTERRPIVLNVPVEFQWNEIEYRPVQARIPDRRTAASSSVDLDDAIGIIAAAKRPLVLAGRGVIGGQARGAVTALAERIDAPLATTLKAKDLFRGNRRAIGIFGTLSTPSAVDTILSCDCIVAFGASLNAHTTADGTYLRGKRLIQVNMDTAAIGEHCPADAGVVGDPEMVATAMIGLLDEAEIPSSGFWAENEFAGVGQDTSAPDAFDGGKGPPYFVSLLERLDELLPADRILVTDGGRFVRETWKNVGVSDPGSFVTTTNIGSIGLGMAHAIGASLAAEKRPTALFIGDGGFMLGGLTEFNTAVRYGADLIVILCNDGSYGAEFVHMQRRGMDVGITLFDWPAIAPIAIALGGEGITVRSMDDLPAVQRAIANRRKPLLVELVLDPAAMPEY